MGTTYDVVLQLRTVGDLVAHVQKVGSAAASAESAVAKMGDRAKSVSSAFESMGSSVGSVLGGIADKVTSVGLGLAKWGGAALVAGLAYGVANLNASLETTTISLAAIFKAQGLSGNFQAAMADSAGQVEKMKRDVMTLPGTFSQLAQLMQTTATTGIAAGMNEDQLRKFAGRTMLTASIVAPTIDNNLLSKEIVNLLAGKAGTHNILGLRLGLQGDEAKKFNAMSNEGRWKDLEARFDKYKDATAQIATSWKAVSTSLKDNLMFKVFQPITQPLFEHVKADLVKVNEWFVKNRREIELFVNVVGDDLAKAWDKVIDVARELAPIVERIGSFLMRMDFSKLTMGAEKMGLAYTGLKLASVVAPATGALLGKSIAATSAEGLAAGAGAVEVSIVSFLGASALAAVGLAFAGAAHNLSTDVDHDGNFHKSTTEAVKGMAKSAGSIGKSVAGVYGDTAKSASFLGSAFANTGDFLLSGAAYLADGIHVLTDEMSHFSRGLSTMMPGWEDQHLHLTTDSAIPAMPKRDLDDPLANLLKRQIEQRQFGVTVGRVEIVVKGSDDPSRVARLTLEHLERLGRHKLSSPYVSRP